MNLKSSKRGFKKENMNYINFILASLADMVIHCCIWLIQKSQLLGTFRGGGKYFDTSISQLLCRV